VWHDPFRCATWLIHMCDMTHSYVWHDSFICVAWLIHMCDMTHSFVWHDPFICLDIKRAVYKCVIHTYMSPPQHMCTWVMYTWLNHPHTHVYTHIWMTFFLIHIMCTWVTWVCFFYISFFFYTSFFYFIHIMCTWVMTHMCGFVAHICVSSGTRINESCHICEWVMSHRWMSHVTDMEESCPLYTRVKW